jgi:hypothetical protein
MANDGVFSIEGEAWRPQRGALIAHLFLPRWTLVAKAIGAGGAEKLCPQYEWTQARGIESGEAQADRED